MSLHKYRCKCNFYKIETEIPLNETAQAFGEKLPCGKCGKIGLQWAGSA